MIKRIIFSLLLAFMLVGSFPAVSYAECPPMGCGLNATCNQTTQQCETTNAAQPQGGTVTQPATPSASAPTGFVPLTTIPAIREAAGSPNLPAFLNSLYKICIGAAAVLAVLQIIRGGIVYMLGDSVTEKRVAREHITLAVFGLVLVLSPAIVFGVIDPKILELNVSLDQLTPSLQSDLQGAHNGTVSGGQNAIDSCTQRGGTPVFQAGDVMRCDIPTDGQTGAGTVTSETGTTLNYRDLPSVAGHSILVLMKFDESAQPRCLMLAYKSFADQAACTQGAPAIRTAHDGWAPYASCEATPQSTFRVQSSNAICSSVEAIP